MQQIKSGSKGEVVELVQRMLDRIDRDFDRSR